MRLYLAGPIAGALLTQRSVEFTRQRVLLEECGYDVLNPLDLPPQCDGSCTGPRERDGDEHARTCYLKWDIIEMLKCDAVALLPGWKHSKGATEEARIAEHCGMPVRSCIQWRTRALAEQLGTGL